MKVGIDMEDNSRFVRIIEQEHFMERVFAQEEREYIAKKGAKAAAGIFCVKEAFGKALGSGIFNMKYHDVVVLREESGKPYLRLTGKYEGVKAEISISHSGNNTVAVCIIED